MAPYVVDSEKIFVRCCEMHTMDVHELDGVYVVPVKGKHWSHLARVGPGRACKALKLGVDGRDIEGPDLEKLMRDLYNSRLIVNREGLCLVATPAITAKLFGVEYYRLLDIFDWSTYQLKPSVINTKWGRNGIVDGRPLMVDDHLDEERRKHRLELEEEKSKKDAEVQKKEEEIEGLKVMYEQKLKQLQKKKLREIKGLKHKHKHDMVKKMRKHKKELEEEKCKKAEELEKKQKEIEDLKAKNEEELEKQKHKRDDELRKRQDEIQELKGKHKGDLEELEHKKKQELQEKEKEIEDLKHKSEIEKLRLKVEELDKEKELRQNYKSQPLPYPSHSSVPYYHDPHSLIPRHLTPALLSPRWLGYGTVLPYLPLFHEGGDLSRFLNQKTHMVPENYMALPGRVGTPTQRSHTGFKRVAHLLMKFYDTFMNSSSS